MKVTGGLFIISFFSGMAYLPAQSFIEFNTWVSLELSKGQQNSHYFYNQIHQNFADWRLGCSDINALAKINLSKTFKLNVRGRLTREEGDELRLFQLPNLNLQFQPKGKNWFVLLGRFITPTGGFSDLQHPKNRIFIGEPLRHSFYNNVSPKIGFVENLGENKFKIDEAVEWGNPMLYYGAYTNGLQLKWDIQPDKFSWTIALTNGAPNILPEVLDFNNFGVLSRIKYRPSYFWKQQFSFSYGSFLEKGNLPYKTEDKWRQLLLGTDFLLEYGFWAISGEVLYSRYHVLQFFPEQAQFSNFQQNLVTTAYSLNAKYEMPFLSGSYAAVGVEWLTFGKYRQPNNPVNKQWDDNVWRVQLGAGYKIKEYLLFQIGYNILEVENQPSWEQNTFRSVLTLHY